MVSTPRLDGQIDSTSAAKIGILLCRKGKWHRALDYLSVAASSGHWHQLPASYHSFLGLATAVVTKNHLAGERLCEVALKRYPCEIDNYVNMVKLRLLADDTSRAWSALRQGLALIPDDPRLRGLLKDEFPRQEVVVRWLRRSNPINVLLGRIRYRIREDWFGSYA